MVTGRETLAPPVSARRASLALAVIAPAGAGPSRGTTANRSILAKAPLHAGRQPPSLVPLHFDAFSQRHRRPPRRIRLTAEGETDRWFSRRSSRRHVRDHGSRYRQSFLVGEASHRGRD